VRREGRRCVLARLRRRLNRLLLDLDPIRPLPWTLFLGAGY